MSNKLAVIDIDSTICNLLKCYQSYVGTGMSIEDAKTYVLSQSVNLSEEDHRAQWNMFWESDAFMMAETCHQSEEALYGFKGLGYTIILLTQRWPKSRAGTEHWLRMNNLMYDHLAMIGIQGDSKIKNDGLTHKAAYIRDKLPRDSVAFVVDDHADIVRDTSEKLRLESYLVDMPYNRHLKCSEKSRRVNTLYEVYKLLDIKNRKGLQNE